MDDPRRRRPMLCDAVIIGGPHDGKTAMVGAWLADWDGRRLPYQLRSVIDPDNGGHLPYFWHDPTMEEA